MSMISITVERFLKEKYKAAQRLKKHYDRRRASVEGKVERLRASGEKYVARREAEVVEKKAKVNSAVAAERAAVESMLDPDAKQLLIWLAEYQKAELRHSVAEVGNPIGWSQRETA